MNTLDISKAIIATTRSNLTESAAAYHLKSLLDKALDTPTEIKVFRENKDIPLPKYNFEGDACCDLICSSIEYLPDGFIFHTGLHVALPENYEMQVRTKSRISKTNLILQNDPGTIDSGFRGEITLVYKILHIHVIPSTGSEEESNEIKFSSPYGVGDEIGQLSIRRVERICWQEVESVEELGLTDRQFHAYGEERNK